MPYYIPLHWRTNHHPRPGRLGDQQRYMHAATVAPDGSNAQVVTLTQEAVARINYLSTYPQTENSLPTTEQIVHYAATGDHSWDTTITLTETRRSS